MHLPIFQKASECSVQIVHIYVIFVRIYEGYINTKKTNTKAKSVSEDKIDKSTAKHMGGAGSYESRTEAPFF